MGWQEKDKMRLRKEFVLQATQEDVNMAELCRRYEVSRKTGYKWMKRYQAGGASVLCEQSRKPHHSPDAINKTLVNRIICVREKHPRWGARKIKAVLKRTELGVLPAVSTIHKVLQTHGYIKENISTTAHMHRFEHDAPNRLWQMDFKGHFAHAKGRCHPLTILDDHSRFSIGLRACANETGETVTPCLIEIFRRYGLPERINVDNGHPWGSLFECARYTTFSVWLIRLGVKVSYSRPRHPQTNGKDERFHRTLKAELLDFHYFRNLEHVQNSFDGWRDVYNLERPHEALGMEVPAKRYQPSYRVYPEIFPEVSYAGDYQVRRVDNRGRISMKHRQIFVGVPFAREPIGLRATDETDVIEIFYCHQALGKINLNRMPKKSSINLYSGKVTLL